MNGFSLRCTGKEDISDPHALELCELRGFVEESARGSLNAMVAGFDGAKLHGTDGCLLNEFLALSANTCANVQGVTPEDQESLSPALLPQALRPLKQTG